MGLWFSFGSSVYLYRKIQLVVATTRYFWNRVKWMTTADEFIYMFMKCLIKAKCFYGSNHASEPGSFWSAPIIVYLLDNLSNFCTKLKNYLSISFNSAQVIYPNQNAKNAEPLQNSQSFWITTGKWCRSSGAKLQVAKNAKFRRVLHVNKKVINQVLCTWKQAKIPRVTKKLKVRKVVISANWVVGIKKFLSIEVTLACTTGKVERVPKKLKNSSTQIYMNDGRCGGGLVDT